MKAYIITGAILSLMACNSNNTSDAVERADSTNEAKQEIVSDVSKTKENTSEFLVKAANGGMAEVAAGKIGEEKAVNKSVKAFAAQMVKDHTAVNDEAKSLASQLNITLPDVADADHQQKIADLGGKKAKDFDKDFIDMMVADHKSTIDLFRDASDDNIAPEVKSFVIATIPKLEAHLAKADSLQKSLK
jgi:putative membrane protein